MKKTVLYLLLPCAIYAQNNLSTFDTYMKVQSDVYGFNGNVLVAKNGEVIYKKSFGYADYNTKKKLDGISIFDCGSIAKQFTALGILLLKDKGKIRYTDTLGKFFPELLYTNVTIQQLLTHTSGMPDGFELVEKYFDHSKIASNGDLIRLLAREKPPLFFKPGENMMYSGTAFNLLASIIEKISGQSYKTFMAEQVFKPLGMTHTSVANGSRSAEIIPGYAYGFLYSDSLKKYVRADRQPSGWTSYLAGITGEGMIISTTGDLLKWDRALKNHRLLTEKTQREMLSVQAERKNPDVSFGYGTRVGTNEFGHYVFHNGSFPGYISMLLRYTDDDVTAIVLSNNESHSDFIADALVAITLHKNFVMPKAQNEVKVKSTLDMYGGKYMMPLTRPPFMSVFPVEFIIKKDTLYIHPPRGAAVTLKPASATKFFFADGSDQQIEFEIDSSGKPAKVWHIAWGVKRVIKKID